MIPISVVLWIVQVLLALAFLMAGFMKLTQPIATLNKRMAWTAAVPSSLVRFIGLAELLGGVGLILPMLTGVLPWLTVAAAIGLSIVMVSAAVFHLARHEASQAPINIVLLALALFVVVGRLAIVPV
jgi:putative oxidoreductase